MQVIAYARVSTQEQGNSGAGIAAQKEAILRECERRNWELVEIVEEVASGASLAKRPLLSSVLHRLEGGEAQGLIVAKVDRLSRSLIDFAALVELSRKQGWSLTAMDAGVDTSTPAGEMMVNLLATFAQFERRLISQRTKDALSQKRAQGVKLGRKASIDPATTEKIISLRRQGHTLWGICNQLEAEGIATSRGGSSWKPGSLESVLKGVSV